MTEDKLENLIQPKVEKTFEELYKVNMELDMRIKALREQEEVAKEELKKYLNNLDNIQKAIKIVDEQFEVNCLELQELNKNI